MSAREVWSRAGSRATALYGVARLRHSLPPCQNSPAERLTSLPLSFPRSPRLHLLRWNHHHHLLLPPFLLTAILFPAASGLHRRQMSPESRKCTKDRKRQPLEDNPRLKPTLTENCLFFKVYKYFSITCRHFLSL